MTSEPTKLLHENGILGSAFADGLGSGEQTVIAVTAGKLNQWMTESVMEVFMLEPYLALFFPAIQNKSRVF